MKALQIYDAQPEPDLEQVARYVNAVDAMGKYHFDRGDAQTALGYYQRGAKLVEDAVGPNSRDLVPELMHLAEAEVRLRRPEVAIEHLDRCLDLLSRDSDNPVVARIYRLIGTAHFSLDEMVEAERAFADALRVAERSLPDDHPMIPRLKANMAAVAGTVGDNARAESLLIEALRPGTLPRPSQAVHMRNLGALQLRMGRPTDAEVTLNAALALEPGNESYGALRTRKWLAQVQAATGHYGEGVEHFQELIRLQEAAHVGDPSIPGETRYDLAAMHSQYGDFHAAGSVLDDAASAFESSGDTLDVASALIEAGHAYQQARDQRRAETRYRRVSELISLLEGTGRPEEAEWLRAQLAAVDTALLPP